MRRYLFALIALVVSSFGSIAAAQDAPKRPPNVIVFLADDLGYADLGFQGAKDVKTPHIDAIATNGVRFTNAYASCPVCAPTRAGMLTGRYQQRYGFEQNPSPQTPPNYGLPAHQVTLAEVLKGAGYVTGAFGKWHLGLRPNQHPMSRGFDEFFGFLAGAHDYYEVGEDRQAVMKGREPVQKLTYMTDDIAREAAAFVERHGKGDKPFFLYVPFSAVHTPMQVPEKYLARFPDESDKLRRELLAMLSATDDAVGAVMDRVRAAGREDDTLVFFLSDNGGPTKGNGSRNTPFSGFKNNVREGGIRVPMAMQWKRAVPAGKTYDRPVMSFDVFTTVLTATGAKAPANQSLDGVDLVPFVAGQRADARPHDTLYWRYGEKWAVRDGDMKLTHAEAGAPKLFDLAHDPSESNDLSASKSEVRDALQKKYDAWTNELIEPLWRDHREKPLGGARAARD